MRLADRLKWLAPAALACAGGAAHADPLTLVTLATQWAVTTGAIGAWTALGIMVGANLFASAEARRKARSQAAAARAQYNASLTDRMVTAVNAEAPWRIVYGRCITGGDVVGIFTSDKTGTRTDGSTYTKADALKHLVIVVAAHEVQAINEVYIDGVALGALDGSGYVTTGEFSLTNTVHRELSIAGGGSSVQPGPVTVLTCWDEVASGINSDGGAMTAGTYTLTAGNTTINNTTAGSHSVRVSCNVAVPNPSVRVLKHLGSPSQTYDTVLAGLVPAEWNANDRLQGLAYVVVTLDLENQRFQGGPPQFTFDVSGKKVYDPRSTLTQWSDNPALCIRDFLTGEYGYAIAAADVDDTYVNAAANACDVTFPFTNIFQPQGWAGGALASIVLSVFKKAADLLGWTATNATIASTGGSLTVTATASDPQIRKGSLSYNGTTYTRIVAKIKRTAGAGWDGTAFYTTGGHGESTSFCKTVAQPTYGADGWAEVSWDMTALTAGGTDWTASTITGIRLDLGSTASDVFLVEYITVQAAVTMKTYTCNGVFTTAQGKEAVLQDLEECMGGWVTEGPKWLVQAGAWTAAVMTLGDDDLHGQIEIVQAATGLDEIFNTVRGTFIPGGSAVPADIDVYANASYVTADGQPLYRDVTLPFTDHKVKARNLCRVMVEKARHGLVIRYPAKLRAWPLQIGDRVTVNSTEYGFASQTFRVTDWDFTLQGAVLLTMQWDVASIYDLADTPASEAERASGLANPWVVAAPAGVTVNTSGVTRISDGTFDSRARVSWNAITDPYLTDGSGSVLVRWRRQYRDADNVWQAEPPVSAFEVYTFIDGLRVNDTITVEVRFRNGLGALSEPVYVSHTVSDNAYLRPELGATVGANAGNFSGTVSGVNLVANSDFEYPATGRPAGWLEYNNAAISTTYTQPAGRNGTRAYGLKANASSSSTFGLRGDGGQVDAPFTGGVTGGWIAGRTYVLTLWAKKVNGASWTNLDLRWNTAPSSVTAVANPNLTTSWQRYVFRIVWGGSVETGGSFFITVQGNTVANDEIHVDMLQVQEGDVATEWQPAKADALVVTPGAVDTANLAANSATKITTDTNDFAGAAVNSGNSWQTHRTLSAIVTPVACSIETTATLTADNLQGDSAQLAGWWVSVNGGADTQVNQFAAYSASKQTYFDHWVYSASAGDSLVFKLKSKAGSLAAIHFWTSNIRFTEVRR